MAKLQIKKASTDVTLYVFVQDSASTTGGGKTGIAYNAASFTAYYVRPLASAAAITLATQTVTGAHSDGGWVEVDSTNMPGVYRFDLPDAVCADGVNSVAIMLKGASGMAPLPLEIDLTAYDPQSATNLGLSNLDAAVTSRIAPTVAGRTLDVTATGAAGIDWANVENPTTTVGLSGTTVKTATDVETDTADIQSRIPASLVSGRIDASVGAMAANTLTASALATDAVTEIQSGLATPTNITAATGITVAAMGANTLTAAALAADAVAEIQSGLSTLDAAGVRTAVGMASANLDTQISALPSAAAVATAVWNALASALTTVGSVGKLIVDNLNAAITSRMATFTYTAPLDAAGTRTALGLAAADLDTQLAALPTAVQIRQEIDSNSTKLDQTVGSRLATSGYTAPPSASTIASAVGSRQPVESYAADGTLPTYDQFMWMIAQGLLDYDYVGTTITVKKLDGSAAMTFTTNDAAAPTSRTRAS